MHLMRQTRQGGPGPVLPHCMVSRGLRDRVCCQGGVTGAAEERPASPGTESRGGRQGYATRGAAAQAIILVWAHMNFMLPAMGRGRHQAGRAGI